jgi:hypothetical protein
MPFINQPKIYDNIKDNCYDKYAHPCTSSEHNPPSMMVYSPGEYTYQCPVCGQITKFIVYGHTL